MSGGVESKKAENKPRAMSLVWPVLEKQGKKVKQEKTPGKDQPHWQKENRGRVSGLALKTKKMWPGRSCKGGEDHREPRHHVFYDIKVASTSHTVSRNAGT